MNRYRINDPKPDIVLPGEKVSFHGGLETGTVIAYANGKYSIRVEGWGAPAFHFNVKEVERINE